MGVARGVPSAADAVAPGGLTSTEAAERLRRDGPNLLPEPRRASSLRLLAAQLTHLLAVLLWVASGLALLAGMPELAAAILVIIVLNGGFAFWQEHRADRSAQRLRALLPSDTRVVRDGRTVVVQAAGLVVGDVVLLEAGDRVAADLSVVSARSLGMDESMVTGESGSVPRHEGDRLLGGSFVVQGDATCLVAATGTSTTLAGIADLAASAERPPSPLTRQLDRVVRVLAVIATGTGVGLGAVALGLGLTATEAFLFGVGVAVALVPEGMLPTVTLSLARGAQSMAARQALVRRLDAVETLGATTFICTDKTGTLTQNRMNVVEVVTPVGSVTVEGNGYEPVATAVGPRAALDRSRQAALAAVACVTGRVVERTGEHEGWQALGDPMEAALHCFALRLGAEVPDHDDTQRRPYSSDRMLTSALDRHGEVSVLGAPESVLRRCSGSSEGAGLEQQLDRLTTSGRRVLAVARRTWTGEPSAEMEAGLELLGLVALEDPPRPDVRDALAACREAGIRVAMISGDHPRTAEAIARQVGLLGEGGLVVTGDQLPADDAELAALLDRDDGVVVARVSPADKFRIASSLRGRGHVVAMTGDGVNDAPALREADVGIAMGASGSDVAREAADLVLLDDHFATIVAAIELGRATFRNIRRFLTYHLTDNVAELAPFAVWALSGGNYPLAISVLQVLALDIGTDLLPALALGAEPPRDGIMHGSSRRRLVDRSLLVRALAVLGLTEAVLALGVCTIVLTSGGWTWGETPSAELLAVASGSTFAAIAVAQMANAFACRSAVVPAWRMPLLGNRLVLAAVAAELVLLVVFLGVPSLADLLGGSWPAPLGWLAAGAGAAVLVLVDGAAKRARAKHRLR
ncbi:cation-transporting P-type ATPase [Nocardioides sp.]|uniref:cation-translocating P-type ATPase n=1 Tax=Nocardioides sp. TaxID=35761 RepID=UPI001A1B0A1C|nr:cation-transporting P-type ATPase [Nocardioides sp.]MBJ7356761.1 cation-transporting P-type ATPase [Nocardioides sp.]